MKLLRIVAIVPALVWVVTVGYLAYLYLLPMARAALSACEDTVAGRFSAPNGEPQAVVLHRDCGGATVTRIVRLKKADPPVDWEIFRTDIPVPVLVRWRQDGFVDIYTTEPQDNSDGKTYLNPDGTKSLARIMPVTVHR